MPSCRKATTRISGSWSEAGASWRAAVAGVAAAVGLLGMAAAGWRAATVRAADPPRSVEVDKVAAFMRAKLGHSQNVLEGLSLEDYDLIARGAQELSLASQESSWQVLQTEDYVRQSAEFRRACDNLRRAADTKNLDGAVLAWMEVTMKCVQCHRYVRDEER